MVHIGKLQPNLGSFLKNAPRALFNVFFMPHVFMKQSFLSWLSSIENLLLLLMLIITSLHLKIKNRTVPLFWFCLFFVFFTFLLIGLTTPVYGAIVRYKVPALPFLMVLMFLLMDNDKFKNTYNSFIKRKS
ncbi:MAG: hypothetical protein BWY70_01696 [Bacteroidetes bacterium ADurb.Bin408]|nr:MAG: hypothetical protein BWY70_01696 [Bacteroidetes bacterium ADurb.Bin408]